MKKTIKLALVATMFLGVSSAFATNGDVMIGQAAKARAMGGVGIATSFGSESGLANPALINSVENKEVTGAVTFFMPQVDFASNAAANAGGTDVDVSSADSEADFSVIPEIAFAHRIDKNFVYGISMTGVAGMGTDYFDNTVGGADDNGAFEMKTELQIMKIAIPLSYEKSGFAFGLAPILQYGSLQMSHKTLSGFLDNGASTDIGYGVELGMVYNFKNINFNGLTAGLVYKSKIKMEYDNTLSASIGAFGLSNAITSGDKLDQPAEFGVGLSYNIDGHTVAFDYRNISWASATGYSDFGWEDQNVFALGYEYATSAWALRAGYNYAKNPVSEQDGTTYKGAIQNFFNLSGFPGIVESHITFGGGYVVNNALTVDAAFIYAPEVSVSYNTTAFTESLNASAPDSTAEVSHSQIGFTVAASYKF